MLFYVFVLAFNLNFAPLLIIRDIWNDVLPERYVQGLRWNTNDFSYSIFIFFIPNAPCCVFPRKSFFLHASSRYHHAWSTNNNSSYITNIIAPQHHLIVWIRECDCEGKVNAWSARKKIGNGKRNILCWRLSFSLLRVPRCVCPSTGRPLHTVLHLHNARRTTAMTYRCVIY